MNLTARIEKIVNEMPPDKALDALEICKALKRPSTALNMRSVRGIAASLVRQKRIGKAGRGLWGRRLGAVDPKPKRRIVGRAKLDGNGTLTREEHDYVFPISPDRVVLVRGRVVADFNPREFRVLKEEAR